MSCFLVMTPKTTGPHLPHWGRLTHMCVYKPTIIGSDNGLSPGQRQAIIWTNAGILLIGPLEINFSEILIDINIFSFNKMHLKMSYAKWRLFRLGLNELKPAVYSYAGWRCTTGHLTHWGRVTHICVNNLMIIIGSYNGLSSGRHQAII